MRLNCLQKTSHTKKRKQTKLSCFYDKQRRETKKAMAAARCTLSLAVLSRKKLVVVGMVSNHQPR